jgi:hypothetical protein
MSGKLRVRCALALVGLAVAGVVWAGKPTVKQETITGKVVPLADVLGKEGVKLDAEAAPHWLALVTDAGKVHPLVKDDGSRLFFNDKALLNRPMQVSGRFVAGGSLLQVSVVNSLHKGKPYEVYYWCEVCAIRRAAKNTCECCGGPMELKEVPIK